MSYKYVNPNPEGKRVGDCAIRAIAIAENLTWDEAYDLLTEYGRELKNLPNANEVWGAFLRDRGYTRHVLPDTCPDCYTIGDFAEDHPKGLFVVATGSHVVTIIDGCVMDAWDSRRETVTYFWEARE